MKRFNGITLGVAFCSLASQAALAQTKIDTLKVQHLNEVIVKGVRATKEAPYAIANIKKSELQQFSSTGKELPFLLSRTPGILAWGENGIGTGTTYMRIRGAAGSRINVTLDGVALNSPEDQTVFWANMNSYASLLGSVQVQRGVGSSTNGDGAFGGSISMATAAPSLTPMAEVTGSYGTYNTYNTGISFSTGLMGNHLVFDGAYHETATDGYIDGTDGRSGSNILKRIFKNPYTALVCRPSEFVRSGSPKNARFNMLCPSISTSFSLITSISFPATVYIARVASFSHASSSPCRYGETTLYTLAW